MCAGQTSVLPKEIVWLEHNGNHEITTRNEDWKCSPSRIRTTVPWNLKPVCYQLATLTPLFKTTLVSFQAAMDLRLTRGRFLQNFGPLHRMSSSADRMSSSADRKLALIHLTKLFPPLADYLDAMELCLMTVVKISKPKKINSWDLITAKSQLNLFLLNNWQELTSFEIIESLESGLTA